MIDDDVQVGRLLNRREILELLGISGAGVLAYGLPAEALEGVVPACAVRPAQTEGPYFVEERLLRSDIRADPTTGVVKAGALLELTFAVSRAGSSGAHRSRARPWTSGSATHWACIRTRGIDCSNTLGQKFLRGHQMTDAAGTA